MCASLRNVEKQIASLQAEIEKHKQKRGLAASQDSDPSLEKNEKKKTRKKPKKKGKSQASQSSQSSITAEATDPLQQQHMDSEQPRHTYYQPRRHGTTITVTDAVIDTTPAQISGLPATTSSPAPANEKTPPADVPIESSNRSKSSTLSEEEYTAKRVSILQEFTRRFRIRPDDFLTRYIDDLVIDKHMYSSSSRRDDKIRWITMFFKDVVEHIDALADNMKNEQVNSYSSDLTSGVVPVGVGAHELARWADTRKQVNELIQDSYVTTLPTAIVDKLFEIICALSIGEYDVADTSYVSMTLGNITWPSLATGLQKNFMVDYERKQKMIAVKKTINLFCSQIRPIPEDF